MSMLSAQCDELRYMTKRLWGSMPYTAQKMIEAADTIWRLRNQNLELHDKVDELEEQIDHLRNVVETLWPRAAYTMGKTCKETWIAELGELGVEVEDDEHSEY